MRYWTIIDGENRRKTKNIDEGRWKFEKNTRKKGNNRAVFEWKRTRFHRDDRSKYVHDHSFFLYFSTCFFFRFVRISPLPKYCTIFSPLFQCWTSRKVADFFLSKRLQKEILQTKKTKYEVILTSEASGDFCLWKRQREGAARRPRRTERPATLRYRSTVKGKKKKKTETKREKRGKNSSCQKQKVKKNKKIRQQRKRESMASESISEETDCGTTQRQSRRIYSFKNI